MENEPKKCGCTVDPKASPFDLTQIRTELISVTSGGVKYSATQWREKQAEEERKRKETIRQIIQPNLTKCKLYVWGIDGEVYEVVNGKKIKL